MAEIWKQVVDFQNHPNINFLLHIHLNFHLTLHESLLSSPPAQILVCSILLFWPHLSPQSSLDKTGIFSFWRMLLGALESFVSPLYTGCPTGSNSVKPHPATRSFFPTRSSLNLISIFVENQRKKINI